MPTRSEVLRNRPIRGEKPLRMSRRFKPLYPSLPLTGPLMRVLGAILEVFVLPMFDPRQKLLLGGAVAFQFIGYDHALYTAQRVRCDPSVDGAPRCLVASLGLLCPQRPPCATLRLWLHDGKGWRGRLLVSTFRGVELRIVWGCQREQMADAVIEAECGAF